MRSAPTLILPPEGGTPNDGGGALRPPQRRCSAGDPVRTYPPATVSHGYAVNEKSIDEFRIQSLWIPIENDIIELDDRRTANQSRRVKNYFDVGEAYLGTGSCSDSDDVVSDGRVLHKDCAGHNIDAI